MKGILSIAKIGSSFRKYFFFLKLWNSLSIGSNLIQNQSTLTRLLLGKSVFFFIKELVRGPVKDTEDDDTKTKTKKKKRKKERKKRKRNINRGSRVKRP